MLVWPLIPWAIAPRSFVQVSPFVALASSIATRSISLGIVFALIVAVVSSFKKRWFCLYLCPDRFPARKCLAPGFAQIHLVEQMPASRQIRRDTHPCRCAVAGYPVLLWMDPLCIFSSPFAVNKATNPILRHLSSASAWVFWSAATLIFGMLWCVRICPLSGLQDMLFATQEGALDQIQGECALAEVRSSPGVSSSRARAARCSAVWARRRRSGTIPQE